MLPVECPICRNADGGRCVEIPDHTLILRQLFECDICHRFGLTMEALRWLRSGDDAGGVAAMHRAILSHQVRTVLRASNELPPLVDGAHLKAIESHGQLPSPIEQANTLLRYIGDEVRRTGMRLGKLPHDIQAIVGAMNRPAAMQRVEQLRATGAVSCGAEHHTALTRNGQQFTEYGELDLTLDGWNLYEEQKRGRTAGNYGFVALQFDNKNLRGLLDAVRPAIEKALGLELRDMRDVARAGIIDNIMRVQIRGSAFVLADLTDENRGAYWEAGYAEGLGKPVIYICEREKFSKAKTHFDTNHCTTITWSADDTEGFAAELIATLQRSLDERESSA